jgi:hypothetical protein
MALQIKGFSARSRCGLVARSRPGCAAAVDEPSLPVGRNLYGKSTSVKFSPSLLIYFSARNYGNSSSFHTDAKFSLIGARMGGGMARPQFDVQDIDPKKGVQIVE